VLDDFQDSAQRELVRRQRAIVLAIQRQPGTKPSRCGRGEGDVAALSGQLPASVQVNTLYDRSLSIRQS